MALLTESPRMAGRVSNWVCGLFTGLAFLGLAIPALADDLPVPLSLAQMLRNGNYPALDNTLARYQRAYESGRVQERVLSVAYQAFESADPELEKGFAAWIARFPRSYSARLARAHYYTHLGWITRGARFSKDTSNQRFEGMKDYFSKAVADLKAVLKLKPRHSLAYRLFMGIAMAAGSTRTIDALEQRGLAADPNSMEIRRRYLVSLRSRWRRYASMESLRALPWWSGVTRGSDTSYSRWKLALAAIEGYTRRMEPDAARKPWLKPLLGYADYVRAERLRETGKTDQAVEHYRRALRFGDFQLYLYGLGRTQYRAGRYRQSLDSFTKALALSPQNPEYLSWRARTRFKLDDRDGAFADWAVALTLDPRNPDILIFKAHALRIVKRYREALAELEKATLYGAHEEQVFSMIGRIQLYNLRQPKKAVAAFERATRLRSGSPINWFEYARALYEVDWNDCKVMDGLKVYRRLCRKNPRRSECGGRNETIAKWFTAQQQVVSFCWLRSRS